MHFIRLSLYLKIVDKCIIFKTTFNFTYLLFYGSILVTCNFINYICNTLNDKMLWKLHCDNTMSKKNYMYLEIRIFFINLFISLQTQNWILFVMIYHFCRMVLWAMKWCMLQALCTSRVGATVTITYVWWKKTWEETFTMLIWSRQIPLFVTRTTMKAFCNTL